MTPELLAELSRFPLFPKTAVDLVRVAGIEAAAMLIKSWPGQEWPVPKYVGGGTDKGARRWEQLLELVGPDAAQRIVREWGAGWLIVPNLKAVLHQRNQACIRDEYDSLIRQGYSSRDAVFSLGIKYNFNGRAIERIIRQPDTELTQPLGQGSLF